MKTTELCRELSGRFMPFAEEASLLKYLRGLVETYASDCQVDTYGSLIAHQSGAGQRVMISAQVDVPTVMVTYVEEDGRARFLMTGKRTCCIEEGALVRFAGTIAGVLYDEGCACAEDLQRMRLVPQNGALCVGAKGVLEGPIHQEKTVLCGANCGVAAACAALVDLMKQGNPGGLDLYYVLSIGSEAEMVSQRGVLCASLNLRPDVGISLEPITVADASVVPGRGPVVLLQDEHAVLRRDMLLRLRRAVGDCGIVPQYAAVCPTSRETALYHYQCGGALAATLCLLAARWGTGRESVVVEDITAGVTLARALLRTFEE